ncbi:MAG TPA: hypothetical protein DDY91_11980 [Planctomycetaceae bacterium]|nr:hypothetical protein [Planctomycetaceae bacterium]
MTDPRCAIELFEVWTVPVSRGPNMFRFPSPIGFPSPPHNRSAGFREAGVRDAPTGISNCRRPEF